MFSILSLLLAIYSIIIFKMFQTNSEYSEAGTLSRVQMRVMGKEGEKTDWITLNSFLPDKIGTGESRTYKLETPDVGKPILVEMSEY